jgi:hypothetical protein
MIGGNITAYIERMTDSGGKNAIGETVPTWKPVSSLVGWLDLMTNSGGTGPNYMQYSAPIVESTHIFLADYSAPIAAVRGHTCRAIIDGQRYAVQLIDDPMEMHRQLEIYLKHTSGQEGMK